MKEDRHANIRLDRVVADELELRGTHGLQAHWYSALLEMMHAGTLAPESLVQETLSLGETGQALTELGRSSLADVQVVTGF